MQEVTSGNVVTAKQLFSYTQTVKRYVDGKVDNLEGEKADKVENATAGNFASLDANGNLTDSGKTVDDFATDEQGRKADSAIQSISVNGGTQQPDVNKKVNISVPTGYSSVPQMDGTGYAGVSPYWAHGDHVHPTDTSREAVNNKVQSINDESETDYPSSKAVAEFVNSSVATNTATFLGNFKLQDLGLTYPATEVQIAAALNSHTWPTDFPTNNDYVYVEIKNPQSTIDDKVQRYKYRDVLASWGYEYTLNNSSFTAEEKAAIDSGITSQDVVNLRNDHTTLGAHVGNSGIHVTSSEKTAWNDKQDAISDLATIRSNAATGASALQPSGDGSNLSVTPDGSSTGYDLESSTTLKAFAQKFKNLVGKLKALAFKDTASYNDLSSGVQSSLNKADTALQSSDVDSAMSSSSTNPVQNKVVTVALDKKTDCIVPATAFGYTLLFTVAFNNTNDRKGSVSFRVHTSIQMQSPIILVGRIGANAAGYGTMYYNVTSYNEDRYKLCYKTVGDNTEVWLIDKLTGNSSERRTAVEFIDIQGVVTVGNNSTSTLPSGLIDFAPGYLKNIKIDAALVNSGTFDVARIPTSSSVTSGDTTHVPTGDAVFNVSNAIIGSMSNVNASGYYGLLAELNFNGLSTGTETGIVFDVTYKETSGSFLLGTLYFRIRKNTSIDLLQNIEYIEHVSNCSPTIELKCYKSGLKIYVYAYTTSSAWATIQIKLNSSLVFAGDYFNPSSYLTLYPNASITMTAPSYGSISMVLGKLNAEYASKIGSRVSHPQVGSPTRPVYVTSDGSVAPCTYGVNVGSLSADSTIIDFV